MGSSAGNKVGGHIYPVPKIPTEGKYLQLGITQGAKEIGLYEDEGVISPKDNNTDVHMNLWVFWVVKPYPLILLRLIFLVPGPYISCGGRGGPLKGCPGTWTVNMDSSIELGVDHSLKVVCSNGWRKYFRRIGIGKATKL